MLDLKWIRENPDLLDAGLATRGHEKCGERIVALDQAHRSAIQELQALQQRRNEVAAEMGRLRQAGHDTATLIQEAGQIKARLPELEEKERALGQELHLILSFLPNLPFPHVPVGKNEDDNVVVLTWGDVPTFTFKPQDHTALGKNLGMMNFEQAATVSGARFVYLHGGLARLERALAMFMVDLHTAEFGYEEMSVPLLLKESAMYGTAHYPKSAEDMFVTTDGRYLLPTAEAPLTNYVFGQTIEAETLPRRYVALSPCFRSEAGAAGKDTHGMIRQHQFWKVELVSITAPEHSEDEHERMTMAAQEVLKRLKLPYRVMTLCTGDMGSAARKTYDLEVWLPGQDRYREISSCSNCGDFQARRMNARYRVNEGGKVRLEFVHTLNGSGLAVGRTLIAVMENYQEADGSIRIPEVLHPYMGGVTVIKPSL